MRESPGIYHVPMASIALSTATVRISSRGASRLTNGHVWVYRSDIVSAEAVPAGSLVGVRDERGKFLGTALYSSASQIALRMIARDVVKDFPALLRERMRDAIAHRDRVVQDTNAYRVIFSEADFLPGLIVDRYADLVSVQILTQAMDASAVRKALVSELSKHLNPASIFERVDPKIRQLEQLPTQSSGLLLGEKTSTIFKMNGVSFHFEALAGQKTGAFLDQRENYAAAAQYGHGEALDAFCYQGGFALHLAPRCKQVTAVDSSRPALEVADKNGELNRARLEGREIEWLEANAFDLLKDYAAAGRQYDTIVLDPPAFAKTRQDLGSALRGYKELNLRALKMLRPGGILVTCSCSYHVGQVDFLEMLAAAARDARRTLRLVEVRGQSKDHPVLLNVPETSYLKCMIAEVSR